MQKKYIIKYILENLKKKRNFKEIDNLQIEKFDYFDAKILDSLEILKFHMNLEKKFKIRFNSKDLTSKKIKTVGGISDIILKRLNI
jgi:acyl carrier protein